MDRPPTLAALVALLVVLLALAPFSHRLASAAAADWIEVCGADGLRRLPTGDSPPAPSDSEDHCPLCRVGDAPAAAPPAPVAFAGAPMGRCGLRAHDGSVGRPTPHDAPPRAPPAPG